MIRTDAANLNITNLLECGTKLMRHQTVQDEVDAAVNKGHHVHNVSQIERKLEIIWKQQLWENKKSSSNLVVCNSQRKTFLRTQQRENPESPEKNNLHG